MAKKKEFPLLLMHTYSLVKVKIHNPLLKTLYATFNFSFQYILQHWKECFSGFKHINYASFLKLRLKTQS